MYDRLKLKGKVLKEDYIGSFIYDRYVL